MPSDILTPQPVGGEVTRANWRTAPFLRDAFHRVSDILPVATIAAAARSQPLPEAPVDLDGFRLPVSATEALDLTGFLEATATDAMIILRDGRLVFETYAGGTTRETPHILMSGSKAITGLVASILGDRGGIDLAAPITRYVPEVRGGGFEGATVRDLLDMRAGVVLDEAQTQAYDGAVSSLPGAAGFHGLIRTLGGPATPHGGPFRYISANTDLVGWALQRATGKSVAELISDVLWQPVGAETDAYVTVDQDGAPWCSGGIAATARALARVGDMLACDGVSGSTVVASKAVVDDLCEGGDRDAWTHGEWGKSFSFISADMSYRAGWYAVHDAPGLLFAMGVHGQNLFVDRANRIVIARLASQAARIDPRAMSLTHRAVPVLQALVLAG